MTFAFEKSVPTPYEIRGTSYNFYPFSLGAHMAIRNLSTSLVSTIVALFSDTKSDNGKTVKHFYDGKDNTGGDETDIQAVSLAIIQYRDEQKTKAFTDAINALTDKKNHEALASLVMDSLRDDFPRPITGKQIEAFVNDMDIPTLTEFVKGALKANMAVFGPLGERLQSLVKDSILPTLQPQASQGSQSTTNANVESSRNPSLRAVPMEDTPSTETLPIGTT